MLCHLYFVRTDALPSGFALVVPIGGCFATSLGLGGCFAAVVLLHLGGCFAAGILVLRWRLCNHSVFAFLFAGFGCSCGVGSFGLWVERVVLAVLLAVVCVVVVCSRLCLYFFSVYLFLVICALVSVKLCLAASSLWL